ncbi:MAG: hypothetical protein WDZ49_12430, partial [Litorilinea sp.]
MYAEKDSCGTRYFPPFGPARVLLTSLLALTVALGLMAGLTIGLNGGGPNGGLGARARAASLDVGPAFSPRGGVITDGDIVSVEKRVAYSGETELARPADVLTYTIVITNNDPATLASILVTDTLASQVVYVPGSTLLDTGSGFGAVPDNAEPPLFPLATGLIITDLDPDATATLRYQVQVTETLPPGDVSLDNQVDVLALSDVISATLAVPALGDAALTLEKRTAFTLANVAPGVLVRSGEPITWTYAVTNTGALSLTEIALVDSDPGVTPTLSVGNLDNGLAPGAGVEYSAAGIAVVGPYSNTSVVSGTGFVDAVGVSVNHAEIATATATSYYFGVAAGLTLTKQVDMPTVVPSIGVPTTTVTYTYGLTNTGNVSLTNVIVGDDLCAPVLLAGGVAQPVDGMTLAISQTAQLSCLAVISQTTSNVATAVGVDPLDAPITATAVATVTVLASELTLVVTPSAAAVSAGTPITYNYTLSNTGDLTVTALALTDDFCTPVAAAPGSEDALTLGLGAGAGATFTCTAVITQPTTNLATVSGVDSLSNTVTATATAFVDVPSTGIVLDKQASAAYVRAGSIVTYTYDVTNTGTISWTDVAVEDDLCSPVQAVDGTEGVIAPSARRTFTCTAVLLRDTTNVATATATLVTTGTITGTISATATAFVDVALYWMPILEKGELPPADCPLPAGCVVPGADDVKALAYHAGLDRLYVLSQAAEQVVMLDPVTFAVLGEAATGAQPWGMVVNETTDRLYVSNFLSGTVSVYAADTLDFIEDLSVAGNPGEMAILPDRDMLFVLTRPDSRVLVFEGSTQVQDLPAGGSGPYGIVADAANEMVYISHRDSGSLALLQWEDDAWTALSGPQFDDDRQYFAVDWNPVSERLYVLTASSDSEWRLEVWKPSTSPPWSRLTAPAIPSGGDIDTAEVGGAGLLVNPATGQIFTANTGADSISRIEGVNDTLADTVDTAAGPFVLALDVNRDVIFVGFRNAGQVAKFIDGN